MSKLLKKAGVFIVAFAAMTGSPAFPSSGKNDSTNLVSFIFFQCALVWSIARVECCGVLFFFFVFPAAIFRSRRVYSLRLFRSLIVVAVVVVAVGAPVIRCVRPTDSAFLDGLIFF